MYDCKLMEMRRAFFAGWMGCGALFFVVDGGWRMPVSPAVRFRAGGSGGGGWGDWRKWGLMRAGGLSGFPGVG